MNRSIFRESEKVPFFDSISFWIIAALAFLLPLFFIPSPSFPLQFTKTILITFAVLLALSFYIISRMKEQKLSLPRGSFLVLLAWLVPLAYLLSALFSSNIRLSLFGRALEIDTFGFMAVMALLLSLIVLFLKSREKIFLIYTLFLASFAVLSLFQFLRLLAGPDFLSFGIFTTSAANTLGTWNDLGIFFGLVTVLAMVTLAALALDRRFKIILYVSLLVSLFFLALINFISVWWLVGFFALGTFIYSLVGRRLSGEGKEEGRSMGKNISFVSLIVLVIAGIFIASTTIANKELEKNPNAESRGIHNYLSTEFDIATIEARPNWQTTVNIAQNSFREHAVFGSGANTFVKQWLLYKPTAVNENIFWNTDFAAGIGTIPTSFITTGIVGGLAWIIFLGFLIYTGIKTLILRPRGDNTSYYLTLSSFLGALYLWTLNVIYTPSVVPIAFAFLLTAVFIASLRYREGHADERTLSFVDNPRLGFVLVFVLTVLFLGSVLALFFGGQKYAAAVFFQRSVREANIDGDLDKAERSLKQAMTLDTDDRFYRFAADIGLVRLNQLFSDTDTPVEELRNQFGILFNKTSQNAQNAMNADGGNYQNWLSIQRVFQSVVPLQIERAYDNAVQAYERALALNPQSPAIEIGRARLELANGNGAGAREFIARALQKKSNYTDAIFLLSQIQISEGEIDEAIVSVEAAAFIDQNNPIVFFQLGLLRYSQDDNEGAIAALQRAVFLNADYSNARYFLGLGYHRVGRTADAIKEFEKIEVLNPDNEEVKLILRNLRQGNEPFAGAEPPIEDEVESRESLPIEEE